MSSSRPRSGRLMGRRLEGVPTASYGEKCTSEKERGEKDEQGGRGRGRGRGGSVDAAGVENVF